MRIELRSALAVVHNSLLANCVNFHTALDMTAVIRQFAQEGWPIAPAGLAALSPYITERIKRFGDHATDGLIIAPAAYDARLDLPPVRSRRGSHHPRSRPNAPRA